MSRNRLSCPLCPTCSVSVHASTRLSRAVSSPSADRACRYTRRRFFEDAGSGPGLAAGHGMCHCLKPEAGIWTAIIAGTLIPAFGGSAVQPGSPTGTFIAFVRGTLSGLNPYALGLGLTRLLGLFAWPKLFSTYARLAWINGVRNKSASKPGLTTWPFFVDSAQLPRIKTHLAAVTWF